MKRLLITLVTGLFAVTTAQAGDKPLKVFRADGHTPDISTWQNYYGKPAKIESDGKSLSFYTWDTTRFELYISFHPDGQLDGISVEARQGQDPLTFTEASNLANQLGFGPYVLDDKQNPTWYIMPAQDRVSKDAFFHDAWFNFTDHTTE